MVFVQSELCHYGRMQIPGIVVVVVELARQPACSAVVFFAERALPLRKNAKSPVLWL